MQFLPKWSQNVSKFILFHIWTAIFKFNINLKIFTNFCISEMFLPISQKCGKSQTWVTGTDVTQKRYILFTWFLVDICRRPISTKPWRAFFDFFFSNFKLRHKIPWLAASWLPWQPRQKSSFMVLCELFLCTTLPILKVLRKLVFELRLLPCLTNQRPSLVTMATRLKRQPFSKSTGYGLRGGISSMWAGI